MEILANSEFWVAVGFVAMIGIFLYVGAPKFVGKHLDDRAIAIKAELDEAARLRAEAQALLADYKRKSANAEAEAAAIVTEAKADAERMAAEMQAALAVQIERRGKQAQDKIASAEAAAMAEIRALAADAAAAAAEKLIAARLDEKRAGALIETSLKDLGAKAELSKIILEWMPPDEQSGGFFFAAFCGFRPFLFSAIISLTQVTVAAYKAPPLETHPTEAAPGLGGFFCARLG